MLLLLLLVCLQSSSAQKECGTLCDYVNRPDSAYEWSEITEYDQVGFTTYVLNVTSQRWGAQYGLLEDEWFHHLSVHIPDTVDYEDAAFIYVSLGRNNEDPPSPSTRHVRRTGEVANATNTITATLRQIPNQPMAIANDTFETRSEDSLIAWTWRECIEDPSDFEILLRNPMLKAIVRAMDTLVELVREKRGLEVDKFMIAGESKRGWNTWLMPAVDERVVAIAPVVLTCLNTIPNMHHHYRALGGWSFALRDYWNEGIPSEFDNPNTKTCLDVVDPYEYLDHLEIPKLIVVGASDEFFPNDDSWYFYDDLPEPKFIWIMENTGHEVRDSPNVEDYWAMMGTFFIGVLQDHEFPEISWQRNETEDGGSITLTSNVAPKTIAAWSAASISEERRDFRLRAGFPPEPTDVEWIEGPVEDMGSKVYFVEYDMPENGWLAFFIKVTFEGPDGRDLFFSSEVNIIPDTLPYPRCIGPEECQGILL